MDNFKETQSNIFDYFKDIPDDLFVKFVDAFVFMVPQTDKAVSDLTEKFLSDNDLTDAFINYRLDITSPKEFFRRTSDSDVEMINLISRSLLVLSHNKLRNYVGKT